MRKNPFPAAAIIPVGPFKLSTHPATGSRKEDNTGKKEKKRKGKKKKKKGTTFVSVFYIDGSVHCNSILIRSNKTQQYAGIYLLQNHSLLVSGVHRAHRQENVKL